MPLSYINPFVAAGDAVREDVERRKIEELTRIDTARKLAQQDVENQQRNRQLDLQALAVRPSRAPLINTIGPDGKPVRGEDVPGARVYEGLKPIGNITTIGPNGQPVRGEDVPGAAVYTPPKVAGNITTVGPNGQPVRGADVEGVPVYQKPETAPGMTPNQESIAINRLQTQWDNATKSYRDLQQQSRNMSVGIDAAKRGDLAQGAQAVLVTFQKILDPTSVVRESEYARSSSGLPLLSQMEGWAERLAKGGAGVPVEELQKFANVANEFVKQSQQGLSGRRARLTATAKQLGIRPELIFDSDAGSSIDAPAATPATAPSDVGWVTLPSGARVRKKN